MERPRVIRLHYNKHGKNQGLPWTLHTSKGCFSAKNVIIEVPTETENKPRKKTNPKYFIKCIGIIRWNDTTAHIRGRY